MNDLKITFAPELELSATDFADTWNSIESCRKLATAKTEALAQQDFVMESAALLAVLSGIGVSVATTALNELVKLDVQVFKFFAERTLEKSPCCLVP